MIQRYTIPVTTNVTGPAKTGHAGTIQFEYFHGL